MPPWRFRDAFMVVNAPPWSFHGTFMVYALQWCSLGTFMAFPWCIRGWGSIYFAFKGGVCASLHGAFIDSHGASMVLSSPSTVLSCSHGAPAVVCLVCGVHGVRFHAASLRPSWCFRGGECASLHGLSEVLHGSWEVRFHGAFHLLPWCSRGASSTHIVLQCCSHGTHIAVFALAWWSHEASMRGCHGVSACMHGSMVLPCFFYRLLCVASRFQFYFFPRSFLC